MFDNSNWAVVTAAVRSCSLLVRRVRDGAGTQARPAPCNPRRSKHSQLSRRADPARRRSCNRRRVPGCSGVSRVGRIASIRRRDCAGRRRRSRCGDRILGRSQTAALRHSILHSHPAAILAVTLIGGISEQSLGHVGLHGIWAGILLALAALTWSTNLFNFMDGIDGIAGSEAVFVGLAGAPLNWRYGGDSGVTAAMLVLAAATAGFLIWNWPPARIFMGDVGSGFLGFVLAVLGSGGQPARCHPHRSLGDPERGLSGGRDSDLADTDDTRRSLVRGPSPSCLSEFGRPMEGASAGDGGGDSDRPALAVTVGLVCCSRPATRDVVFDCRTGPARGNRTTHRCGP